MTKEHKLYELSKELVYQMTGNYTEDTQNADFQIAWTYLNKAMDFIQCCEELPIKKEMNFDGKLLAEIETTDKNLKVLRCVDGGGNIINVAKVQIDEVIR